MGLRAVVFLAASMFVSCLSSLSPLFCLCSIVLSSVPHPCRLCTCLHCLRVHAAVVCASPLSSHQPSLRHMLVTLYTSHQCAAGSGHRRGRSCPLLVIDRSVVLCPRCLAVVVPPVLSVLCVAAALVAFCSAASFLTRAVCAVRFSFLSAWSVSSTWLSVSLSSAASFVTRVVCAVYFSFVSACSVSSSLLSVPLHGCSSRLSCCCGSSVTSFGR